MSFSGPDLLQRFRPWQRRAEVGFWLVLYGVNAVANSITEVMDYRRGDDVANSWQPAVWESTSALASLLLIPFVVWSSRQIAPEWARWRRYLAWHILGSVVFSISHVVLMVLLRHAAYAVTDLNYSFGDWGTGLLYEYLKDARSYAGLVLMIEGYRFALRRLQGEARFLDRSENEPEVSSKAPAERFLVKMLGREFLVPAAQIEYAQAAGNYVNLTVRGRQYPLRSTMKGLLERLDPARFRRVHRGVIVQLDHVAEIEPFETGDARIKMSDGSLLPYSRRYRRELALEKAH